MDAQPQQETSTHYPMSKGGGFLTERVYRYVGYYPLTIKTQPDFVEEIDYVKRQILKIPGIEVRDTSQIQIDDRGFPRASLFLRYNGRELDISYFRNTVNGEWMIDASSHIDLKRADLSTLTRQIHEEIITPRMEKIGKEYKAERAAN